MLNANREILDKADRQFSCTLSDKKRIPCIRLEGPDRLASKAQTPASTGEMQTNIQPTYLEVSLKVSAKNLYNARRGEGHHRSNLRTSRLVQYSFGPVLIFITDSHEGIKSTLFLFYMCVSFSDACCTSLF